MIRKYLFIIVPLFLAFFLSSCLHDDSTLGSNSVSDIAVSGMDDSYTASSYIGEHLKIIPMVNTEYAEDDIAYTWLLLNENAGDITSDGDTIQPTVIGHAKDLDYEVDVEPGVYKLRLEAQAKSNGYTVYATAKLTVQTNFSQGFYIMKETADGNTEVDLLSGNGVFMENLLTKIDGTPMQGKPLTLSPCYSHGYIDDETGKTAMDNAISIISESGSFEMKRLTDLKTIFDRSNLLFDKMADDEKPYAICHSASGYIYYFSSNGLRYNSESDGTTSGRYGLPAEDCGGSRFFTQDLPSFGGVVFWDEMAHSLLSCDYDGAVSPLIYDDNTGEDETTGLVSYDCLHIGYNYMNNAGTVTIILEDKSTGKRYLYLTKSSMNGVYLSKRSEIDAGLHFAKATAFSTNGLSAKYIYCVDAGQIYACIYDNDTLTETTLHFQGIGSGESITYVGNQFWNPDASPGTPFNYLVVGTQKGAGYSIYLYNMVGGAPEGQPVKTIHGTGKLNTVRWISSQFNTNDWIKDYNVYNMNN